MLEPNARKPLPWGGAEMTLLNPSDEAFKDFGVKDPVTKVTYIPNDNLEWRRTGIEESRHAQQHVVQSLDLDVNERNQQRDFGLCGLEMRGGAIDQVLRLLFLDRRGGPFRHP